MQGRESETDERDLICRVERHGWCKPSDLRDQSPPIFVSVPWMAVFKYSVDKHTLSKGNTTERYCGPIKNKVEVTFQKKISWIKGKITYKNISHSVFKTSECSRGIGNITLRRKCWTITNSRKIFNLPSLFLGKFFDGCVGGRASLDIDEVDP